MQTSFIRIAAYLATILSILPAQAIPLAGTVVMRDDGGNHDWRRDVSGLVTREGDQCCLTCCREVVERDDGGNHDWRRSLEDPILGERIRGVVERDDGGDRDWRRSSEGLVAREED